jgi:hypothetical protein
MSLPASMLIPFPQPDKYYNLAHLERGDDLQLEYLLTWINISSAIGE